MLIERMGEKELQARERMGTVIGPTGRILQDISFTISLKRYRLEGTFVTSVPNTKADHLNYHPYYHRHLRR